MFIVHIARTKVLDHTPIEWATVSMLSTLPGMAGL